MDFFVDSFKRPV